MAVITLRKTFEGRAHGERWATVFHCSVPGCYWWGMSNAAHFGIDGDGHYGFKHESTDCYPVGCDVTWVGP